MQQLPAPQLHQEQDDVQPRHNSFSIVKSDHIWNRSITPSALTCSKHGPQVIIKICLSKKNQYILIHNYITSDFEIPVSFESTNGGFLKKSHQLKEIVMVCFKVFF